MATFGLQQPVQDTGFDCEFTDRPAQAFQTDCPVCLQILREPYQASCCGNSFCRVCIERVKKELNMCPTCKKRNFTTFHNKGLQRSLNELQVYCSHKQEGCEWKGELGQLDNHLNLSPRPNKQLQGCGCIKIRCRDCSKLIQRSNIAAHQTKNCPKRKISCKYCTTYKSHHEDVVKNHWPVCGYRPVECPNECGIKDLKRQDLEKHVTEVCLKTRIKCNFHHVGCGVELLRKDMPDHLKENLTTHMSLQAASYKEFQEKTTRLEREMDALTEDVASIRQDVEQVNVQGQEVEQQIAKLQRDRATQSSVMLSIAKRLGIRPPLVTIVAMTRYAEHKRNGNSFISKPFFTHPEGYKLCLRVDANGYGTGRGTHISVFLFLMKGDFDDHLTWPLRGRFTVQIRKRSNQNRGYKKRIQFCTDESASRVVLREMSQNGAVEPKFISQQDAERKYLKHDHLYFCVTCQNTYLA